LFVCLFFIYFYFYGKCEVDLICFFKVAAYPEGGLVIIQYE
jgi:hypothetical protein